MAIEFPAEELLETFNTPGAAPEVAGLNCTVSVTDCPGFNLAGKLAPDTEYPAPCTDTELISSGHVPTEDRVTDCATVLLTGTLPNARPVALVLIVETTAFRLKVYVLDRPAEVAVRVTFCAVPIGVTAAVNAALLAPAGTNSAAGTDTWVSLLARPTVNPPLGAAALSHTVHGSLTVPLTAAVEQESELKAAGPEFPPVPLRLIATEFPADELVERFRTPVALPVAAGLKFTVSVREPPGCTLAGNVPPEKEKPAPCTETDHIS